MQEPNKTIQIDKNEAENVDKTDADEKIIQESPHIERRLSSETTLNTIDKVKKDKITSTYFYLAAGKLYKVLQK